MSYADGPNISRNVSPRMALEFEWDPDKAKRNLKEHGVSFDDATTVLRDTLSITISDPDHSDSESRFIDIGMSHHMELLVVSYTERKSYEETK